ncbi:DUF5996 family protein [Pseudonocardia sp.]|uniref:DUF5996 family protein n=1 Tax=Pseudonocardia sp. TaxID=60912 RepID=UPI0031FE270A
MSDSPQPRRNHWWNVPLHLTVRGITTRPMGLDPTLANNVAFVAHQLRLGHTGGRAKSEPRAWSSTRCPNFGETSPLSVRTDTSSNRTTSLRVLAGFLEARSGGPPEPSLPRAGRRG